MKDYTKTDRIILLLQTICRAPRLCLSEKKVQEILENPSRAQWYKLRSELLEDVGQRRAILTESTDEEGNTNYHLNQCDWVHYLEGTQEIQFTLKFYKELGHLFPKIDTDGMAVSSQKLDRKFHYLCKFKAKESFEKGEHHLETIIRALVGNRKLLIDYKGVNDLQKKTVDIYPLTLTQYRDDLYLQAYKKEMKDENIRSYKVSRILKIQESKEIFKYPNEAKWNPKVYFKNSSGIITGSLNKAQYKVFGESRVILSEKQTFDAEIINQTIEYDEYICTYTNIEEFIGLLFTYGQDIEIVGNKDVKKAFREKAEQILKRNK